MPDSEKFSKGAAVAEKLFPGVSASTPLPQSFTRHTIENVFGDLWQGQDLTIEQRSMMTCAMLVAMNREAEMRLHFAGARNLGIERKTIEAIIEHGAYYAGWPVAVTAHRILNEVWPQ